jgi:hypothetical protein
MMEAMFLGDPGYFFQLNEGVKYYIWRRTLLKLQGTHALIGRLFPHMPVFNFDFRTTFRDIGPRGVPYVVTPHIRRGTYDYFYSCWRRRMFPSSQDDRQEPNNSEHQSNNPNHDKSFENFLIKAKFWDSFDPRVKENSAEGLRLRNAVIRNLIVHLDIAGQRLQKREFKDKDDAIAYIEASVEFWGNPEWQFPEDFVPTPDQHKRLQHAGQIYPYAIAIDKQVKGREPRIRPNARSPPEDNRPVWQVQLEQAAANVAADNGSLIRAVTKEEADFMDYLFDYDYEPEPEPEPEPELEQLDAEVSAQERELLRDTTGNPRFPSDLVMMDSILD